MFSVQLQSLSKTYHTGFRRRVEALKDISLSVKENEIFGFLGPNGAGKTTALKIITGLIKPTKGAVLVFDAPVSSVLVREKIGFLPEHPSYYGHLTGFEVLDFACGLFGIASSKEKIHALLGRIGLWEKAKVRVSEYSKGMIQRLGIAQALVNDPELVILDEPLSGLDPLGRKELKDIIVSLKDEGKTVFFSTHILADVERICDRVGILHKGRLLKVGELADLLSERKRNVMVTFVYKGKKEQSFIKDAKRTAEGYWSASVETEQQKDMIRGLLKSGADIISIIPESMSLEEVFVSEIEKDEN